MSVTELHPDARSSSRNPRNTVDRTESPSVKLPTSGSSRPPRRSRWPRQIERGDLKAKERMIQSNLGLVRAIARTYRGGSAPFADLVQEGTIGLVRAVERFDHRRGVKFSTYAAWWIRRSMLDAIASSNVIRIPAKANEQLCSGTPRGGGARADRQTGRFGRRDRSPH